jgi:hypothetical protein
LKPGEARQLTQDEVLKCYLMIGDKRVKAHEGARLEEDGERICTSSSYHHNKSSISTTAHNIEELHKKTRASQQSLETTVERAKRLKEDSSNISPSSSLLQMETTTTSRPYVNLPMVVDLPVVYGPEVRTDVCNALIAELGGLIC